MSMILTLIMNHLLTIVENELATAEPQIVTMIVDEIQLLISKLENYIAAHAPAVAKVANPALANASAIATNAVQAAGTAALQPVNEPAA